MDAPLYYPQHELEQTMTDEFDFSDLTEIQIPVKVRDKSYTLKEASGESAARYRNAATSGTTVIDDGQGNKTIKVGGLGDLEILLVSECLWTSNGNRVSQSIVRLWPTRIITKLFEKAKEISRLDETDSTIAELKLEREKLDTRIVRLELTAESKEEGSVPPLLSDSTGGSN